MSYVVDFMDVSTVGLESSPVADALAGLRANEAATSRTSTTTSSPSSRRRGQGGDRLGAPILKEERDIVIASPPLEATAFEVEGIRWTYVFYEWACRST